MLLFIPAEVSLLPVPSVSILQLMQPYKERYDLVPLNAIKLLPLEIVQQYLWDFTVTFLNCEVRNAVPPDFPKVVIIVCDWHSNILLGCRSKISGISTLECYCEQ